MTPNEIPTRTLGRTGFDATVLGFGAMELRGTANHHRGRDLEEGRGQQMLNLVLDSGINYIDTSIDYGDAEDYIGEAISSRRDEYFLATKCGCWVGEPPPGTPANKRPPHVFTKENIVAGVEQSLRRMKTDHVDLIQFHQSPSMEVIRREDAIETLLDIQRQGKARFIGSSSTLPNIVDHIGLGVFDVFQIPYSALERDHESVITAASESGSGVVVRGGVAQGAPGEGLGKTDRWEQWNKANLDELLDGMTRTEFVLRFTISHPGMTTTIVGTLNPDHLAQNIATVRQGPLPKDTYEEAKRRLAGD
jgi:aryl-alcohol dehydrogenase-like predicted oxidoreductase